MQFMQLSVTVSIANSQNSEVQRTVKVGDSLYKRK